jgi:DNA-binding MarR family transcriptional regulator
MADVAALLAMDRTTLTAALKPLQRRRLATVSIDRDDKRGRRLTLTPRGRALLAEALPIWENEHALLDTLLAPSDPQRLRSDLKSLHA